MLILSVLLTAMLTQSCCYKFTPQTLLINSGTLEGSCHVKSKSWSG